MKKEYVSHSPAETEAIAAQIARRAGQGDFYALSGDLGAGKTVFVRGFVSALAPHALVSSPSYAILNRYEENDVVINHFDLYRITSEDDLTSTGFFETIEEGITLCEWWERCADVVPVPHIRVTLTPTGDSDRLITLERIGYADTRF